MDLRVYVDGVARIICDLNRSTTVHDIIIALAQYKGKAGRYSLIEQSPNGNQRTVSPTELTVDLFDHPDWKYILRENPSNSTTQPRSKSLDGRRTPFEFKPLVEIPLSSRSSKPKQRETRNNSSSIDQSKNLGDLENRPKSALGRSSDAFQIIQRPSSTDRFHQRDPYAVILHLLEAQSKQIEQQKTELDLKEKEIQYRQNLIDQQQAEEKSLLDECQRLNFEFEFYSKEYSVDELKFQCENYERIQNDYQSLHEKLRRTENDLEKNQRLTDQLQSAIEQVQKEIEQLNNELNNEKKEIDQYQNDLELSTVRWKTQQQQLQDLTTQGYHQLQSVIELRHEQIRQLENQSSISDRLQTSYRFSSPSPNMDSSISSQLGTFWKICPSGIWV